MSDEAGPLSPMEQQAADRLFYEQHAEEASRIAAEWALRLLDGFELRGSAAFATGMYEQLGEMPHEHRLVILTQLVNLVARLGVGSPDIATLKLKLRAVSQQPPTQA